METILRYVPRDLRRFWVKLPGYKTARWHRFRSGLEELYPDIEEEDWCTRQGLKEFVELSAERRIRSESDVMDYYRNFLHIALPLRDDHKLTHKDISTEFFNGFHLDDQEIISKEIHYKINSDHPSDEPFDIQDILLAARGSQTPRHSCRISCRISH